MSAQLFGCIEAGGTKFVLGVMRDHQTVLEETRIPTTAPAETLRACVEFFKDATRRNGRLNAVGIASFGPLGVRPHERGWGTIIRSPKTAWSGTDIVTPFKSAFNCPIGLDTDVNAAVLAESLWGSAQRKDVATYVTVGTGIGGGVLINGKIVHGTRHPEMGHMIPRRHPADGDFAGVCRFHNDCLEGLASGPAIQRRWGATLSELGHNHPAQRIIAFYLAQLVVAQRALLAPQRIVFGGGVMASPGLLSRIRTEATLLERRFFSEEAASDLVVTSELGARTGLLGALALAQTASR